MKIIQSSYQMRSYSGSNYVLVYIYGFLFLLFLIFNISQKCKAFKNVIKFIDKNLMYTTDKKLPQTSYKYAWSELHESAGKKSRVLGDTDHQEMKNRLYQEVRNRGRSLFETGKKQNEGKLSKTYTPEQLHRLQNTENQVEVEKLMLEISRLHDIISDLQRGHKFEIQKLKEDYQHMNILQINNLKQAQTVQNQILETQFRKLKEAFNSRNEEYEELEKKAVREKENLLHENELLKIDLKETLQKKNQQIYEMKQQNLKQKEDIQEDKVRTLEELKQIADDEMNKVLKKLEENTIDLKITEEKCKQKQKDHQKLVEKFENQRSQLKQKISQVVDQNKQKQAIFHSKIQRIIENQVQNSQEEMNQQKQMYQTQIGNLLNILKIKDKQIERSLVFRETEKVKFNYLVKKIQEQNSLLKDKLKKNQSQHMKQIEILKAKMAILHENDIKALVSLYETKLDGLGRQINIQQNEIERLTNFLQEQSNKKYQMKKKYEYTISKLISEILSLKYGIENVEKEAKDKMQSEKNIMMITSQNLIKENQVHASNVKFYEEELRKLRQLLDVQASQVEQSERNVEEKIKLAEDELNRLSNKIIEIKSESEQAQKHYKSIIQEKNQQISRLNDLLIQQTEPGEERRQKVNQQIVRLEKLLNEKEDEIRMQKGRSEEMNNRLNEMRAENQRLYLEGQINSEEARKHFKGIADKNLLQLKKFYERRIKQLEQDKRQLEKINSSQKEHITELMKKYKNLEQAIKELLRQSKRKGELQTKVIHLGMDNNLVKNMAQLFHK